MANKKALKSGFGRVFGFIWEGFGTVLGLFWALLAASWPFFGRSKSSFFQAWAQDGLQEAFWIDFGSIWGGIWEDFGRIFGDFGPSQGRMRKSWKCLVSFGPAGKDSQLGPPRWSAKRHNARGSPTPRVELDLLSNFKSFLDFLRL